MSNTELPVTKDPVLLAAKFSYDYFSLNAEALAEALAPDVEFILEATIFPPSGPSTSITKKIKGKDEVMKVLDARHFGIVDELMVPKLSFHKKGDRSSLTYFTSIETKKEEDTTVTYEYNGSYEATFNEDMKVEKISLKNRRHVITLIMSE